MFKRYFVPNPIGIRKQQHCIALISSLVLMVGSQTVSAQQGVAQDAHAIFEQSCLICHGADGAYKETLLMEHNALITENGAVVPGNPEASRLYQRLLGEGGQLMPLGGPPLPDPQIETVKNWILAGAPDWTAPPPTSGSFISPSEVLNTIESHLNSLPAFDRAFARYFTLTHLYNAGEPPSILQEYRKGLSKLVNSLSWGSRVINPQPIDPQGTILYIDLRHYEWDANDGWGQIEAAYPYHISFDAPTQTALKVQLTRLQGEMKADIPSVHADWFIANGSLPPLYHDLLSLPLTDRELETRLEVDVLRNLRNAPGVRVWRAGTNDSGVSENNRVVERHTSRYGAYWKSYDFAGSVGTQNIFTHPLSFTHDGGEVIFNLPNGLQGYYITTAAGSRLDAAPIQIVSNPAASDPTVRNGLSCFGCHTKGMNTFEDEVRTVIESNATPAYDKAQALRLYVEQSEMDALVQEDMDRYKSALEATSSTIDDIEPIQRFHEVFQDDVDAAYAAAVVGLETEVLLEKIRENVGLRNVGLLVLDSPNGSMKRDAWMSNFPAIIYALDFPDEQVDSPSQPDQPPGAVVRIPDTNLRAAIAEALGKNPNAPITVEEMERLEELDLPDAGIGDLTALQFATNLERLYIGDWHKKGNQVSDLSPIAGLVNLRELRLDENPISDLSPLKNLKNLTHLVCRETPVSDLSPLAGLINLRLIFLNETSNISDLSPLSRVINLEVLHLTGNKVSDLSPLAELNSLRDLLIWGNPVTDLSPLTQLPKLTQLNICGTDLPDLTPVTTLPKLTELYLAGDRISDISLLAGLTGLTRLSLNDNQITDISPLAGLTNLKWLRLDKNEISDISSLAGLTNLTWLKIDNNNISDLAPLDEIRENLTEFHYSNNPAFPKGGPKIQGPWLWVLLPDREIDSSTDLLSEASEGAVTEVGVSTHGATVGKAVSDDVWTADRLPPSGGNNIGDMLRESIRDGVFYGTVSLYSPRQQETTIYVGSEDESKVWLNGELIYENFRRRGADDYTDFFPVTLKQGKNVLLVAVEIIGDNGSVFLGFEPDTEYTVSMGIGYTFSKTPIHTGDTFALDIRAENVTDLAGWQFDIAFDPNILAAISVSEGDFLKTGGSTTFFQGGSIDNAAGKITGLNAARLSTQGATGAGSLLQVNFKAKSAGETELALHKFQFGSVTGDSIPAGPHEIRITVEERLTTGDVNRDGVISILDLILVSQQLGKSVSAGSAVDVNGDGIVSILDLSLVSQGIAGSPAAPPTPPLAGGKGGVGSIDPAMIESWIAQARLEDDGSLAFKQGIANLEKLLASLIPEAMALLANYPNPFNPETWIPYQLTESGEVTLKIYDMNGKMVRRLEVGYKAAGMYRSRSRAAYWDGRNQLGESLASGVYFYTLTTGDFTATRRLVILK